MKILLLNLPRYGQFSVTREGRCEYYSKFRVDTPITLLIIASILKNNGNIIHFIDANGFNLSYKFILGKLSEERYNCVIFSFNSTILDHELKICTLVKSIIPTCITIGFSWYARKFAKEILSENKNLDIQIIDDPFSVINNLIVGLKFKKKLDTVEGIAYRIKQNEIKINSKVSIKIQFNDLPMPAYDLLPSFKPYFIYSRCFLKPYALIYAGKGCPFSCKYCIVSKTKYNGRSADKIIKELKILKKLGKIKYIWFFDEVFTINRKRVIEICGAMMNEKLNIKWFCDTRVDLVDFKLLKIMKKAGCIGIAYGVESGSQKILNLMNKNIKVNQAKKALTWTRNAKIPIQLNLLLGFIGETNETLKETESFVKEILPEVLQVSIIAAKDGTEFTEIAYNNEWLAKNLEWKKKLNIPTLNSSKYPPYNLNLYEKLMNFYKILYLNPKWWLISLMSLIRNYNLILPAIEIFSRKLLNIKSRKFKHSLLESD